MGPARIPPTREEVSLTAVRVQNWRQHSTAVSLVLVQIKILKRNSKLRIGEKNPPRFELTTNLDYGLKVRKFDFNIRQKK